MEVPWANPWFDETEKKEICESLDSTWLGMGPRTKELEEKIRAYIGVKNAIAVSNGTVALDLALKALDIGPGDEVIVPAMTYVATVSAVLYQMAVPVFADIELETYNIDPLSVEKLITNRTKCILYIDYGGNPADHIQLKHISLKYGIPLVQDGAQSLGAVFKGERLCKQGLVSTTSFHVAKLITTVEGGMIFTNDDNIANDIRMRRNQGEDPHEKYIHRVLGTNARMTDLQAAIGLAQFKKFDQILKKRKKIADSYYKGFKRCKKIQLPSVRIGARPSWFFSPVLIENRDRVAEELKKRGIATRVAYPMPVYKQPFFDSFKLKTKKYYCPNAEWMTQRVLNLPMYHKIKNFQLEYIVEKTIDAVNKFSK